MPCHIRRRATPSTSPPMHAPRHTVTSPPMHAPRSPRTMRSSWSPLWPWQRNRRRRQRTRPEVSRSRWWPKPGRCRRCANPGGAVARKCAPRLPSPQLFCRGPLYCAARLAYPSRAHAPLSRLRRTRSFIEAGCKTAARAPSPGPRSINTTNPTWLYSRYCHTPALTREPMVGIECAGAW